MEKTVERKEGTVKGVVMTPQALQAMMFKNKQASGQYVTENVKCFCGADDYLPITETDRYGFEYKLCICKECGLLYANPRMTEDSYKKFYRDDYRIIYETKNATPLGNTLKSRLSENEIIDNMNNVFLDHELPKPKVVFDIGCGTGSLLNEFQGLELHGVDYDDKAVEKAKDFGVNAMHGGIEKLEELGKKADLILMNHVLEHLLYLEKDLLRIRDILSDKGILYISVPGLYCNDKNVLLQNAHTYQFTATTLEYVMGCCGFEELQLDDSIESFWIKSDIRTPKSDKPSDEIRYVVSFLNPDEKTLLPPVRVANKFSMSERRVNIDYAISSGMKEISELVNIFKDESAVIVAGGSTINDYPDKIKEMQDNGCKVYAIDRMYKWCLDRDIVPDYVVVLDASDDVVESFETIHPDTTHLLLAQCQPVIFDMLKGYKSHYFLCEQKRVGIIESLKKNKVKRVTFISPGGSVAIGAMALAVTMGCSNLHIFGFDCHITDGDYAEGIAGKGHKANEIEVEIKDRKFMTTVAYYAFSQHFFNFFALGKELGKIKDLKIYGDSLVKASCKINIDGDKKGTND